MQRDFFLRALYFTCVLLVVASTSYADEPKGPADKKRPGALDVIPEEALLAISIRNVSELIKRGDTFIDKTEFKTPMRLSDGYKIVTEFLRIKKGLDEEGSAALFVMGTKVDLDFQTLVLAVPVGDWKDMAENFRMKPEDLAEGIVIDRQAREGRQDFVTYARFLTRRGGHVYLGPSEVSVAAVAKSKSLRESVSKEDALSLAQDDILFYANPRPLKDEWKGLVPPLEGSGEDLTPDEVEAIRLVAEATQDLQFAAAGLRLDGGLGATALLRFKGEKSREILTRLQGGGKGKASLSGLPLGRVLAAYAAAGDGGDSAAVARALLQYSLAHFVADTRHIISAGHRPNVVGVFGEIWQRLEGSRSALYENENFERDGHFGLVAVLDTQNAEKFVADMSSLARFVSASGLALDDAPDSIDAKTIATLVADLGSDEYRVRQTATTKLGLVGRPALAALEPALSAKDPEVQFRAKAIKAQILALAAEEREDLLKRDLLSRIQPKFAYFPKAETRAGRPVDIVQLRLAAGDAPHAAELRRLLGPSWSKLRLTTVGQRVIVLLGSRLDLFDEAIINMQRGKPGIDADGRFAQFRTRTPAAQTLQLHLTLQRAQELVAAGEPKPGEAKPTLPGPAPITSVSLSISPDRVRLDLFSPFEEVKSVTKKLGW